MNAYQFEITLEVPTGATPRHNPEHRAKLIEEILRHRMPFLFDGLPSSKVTVTPVQPVTTEGK
jgi:hypothetical protein